MKPSLPVTAATVDSFRPLPAPLEDAANGSRWDCSPKRAHHPCAPPQSAIRSPADHSDAPVLSVAAPNAIARPAPAKSHISAKLMAFVA